MTGLSYREAGRHVGVSHVAIGKAVRGGRILPLSDGTVAVADVETWNRGRRAPRGGKHRVETATPSTLESKVTGSSAVASGQIVAQTALLRGLVDQLAAMACCMVPVAIAQELVAGIDWPAASAQAAAWRAARGLAPL